jgi:hypothetical protein
MYACYNSDPSIVKYLSDETNMTQNITLVSFGKFKDIIMAQRDIINYDRFCDLLARGSELFHKNNMIDLLSNVNSLTLKKSIIKKYDITDQFESKFKHFVKQFYASPISVKEYYTKINLT